MILLWNIDHSSGLVNGARGKVVGFENSRGRSKIFKFHLPVVEFRLRIGDKELTETRVVVEQESEIKQGNTYEITSQSFQLLFIVLLRVELNFP